MNYQSLRHQIIPINTGKNKLHFGDFQQTKLNTIIATVSTIHCPKSNSNFRALTQNVEENEIKQVLFLVFSTPFRVISRKIEYLWGQCRSLKLLKCQ